MKKSKICSKCKIPKELDQFNKNKSNHDGLQKYCKQCKKDVDGLYINENKSELILNNKKKIEERKQWYDDLKKEYNCLKCGENRFYLIEFHHLDNGIDKLTSVSNLIYQGKSKIKALEEIKKCIPLCCNCHNEFHYLNKKFNLTDKEYLAYVPANKILS